MDITRRLFIKILALALPASMVPLAPMGEQPTPPQPELELKPYPMYTQLIQTRKLRFDSKNYGIVAIQAPSQRILNKRASKVLDIISRKS